MVSLNFSASLLTSSNFMSVSRNKQFQKSFRNCFEITSFRSTWYYRCQYDESVYFENTVT